MLLYVTSKTVYACLCSPLPILSMSGVDRNDCLSPCFSVLSELWIELVLFHIAPLSVHPPQSGPSSRSLLCWSDGRFVQFVLQLNRDLLIAVKQYISKLIPSIPLHPSFCQASFHNSVVCNPYSLPT